jgi:hypothetical protein
MKKYDWERKDRERREREKGPRKILTVKRITVGGSVFCIPRRS